MKFYQKRKCFGSGPVFILIVVMCFLNLKDGKMDLQGNVSAMAGNEDACMQESLTLMVEDENGYGRLFRDGDIIRIDEDMIFIFPRECTNRQFRIEDEKWQEIETYKVRLHAEVLKDHHGECRIFFRAYHSEKKVWMERSYCFY